MGKAIKTVSHAASVMKEHRKRPRLSSSGQLEDSETSSSEESDVKYSLSADTVTSAPKVGRSALQSTALKRARALQLVTKAREGLKVDKKPVVTRPWAPFWHGRLQLPTQSSRSSRKITINRRFLDDSYTSIGQPGLSQQAAMQDQSSSEKDAGTCKIGLGLLNRPLGSKPVLKDWQRLQSRNKTAAIRPQVRQRKSTSASAHVLETKIGSTADSDKTVASDMEDDKFGDTVPPWLSHAHRSVYSFQSKRGSMVGKHCYICDNTYMVHHHYMCRVPCCRSCARFYKTHCERGTQLDQLRCYEHGKYCNLITCLRQWHNFKFWASLQKTD